MIYIKLDISDIVLCEPLIHKNNRGFVSGQSIGIRFDDEDLSIDWKIDKKDVILSEQDQKLNSFIGTSSPFTYNTNYYL